MSCTERDLVAELRAAHTIIRNALAVMSAEEKRLWLEFNERDGVAGEFVTRANERQALLTRVALAAPQTQSKEA